MQSPPTSTTVPGEIGTDITASYTHVPANLRRANARLKFPPSYVVVGVYRLLSDKNLIVPAWKKCQHGLARGIGIGVAWVATTFKIQRYFVRTFLMNSPKVTGLTDETILGIKMPFDLPTYATIFFMAAQFSAVIGYFISHGLRVSRERAYNQTIESRGKGPDFWKPYVEEWDMPPKPSHGVSLSHIFSGSISRIVVRLALLHVETVPLVGIMISAWLRALGTARYLHKPYFQAKKMTPDQVSVFIEERKWDYRTFGFAAALLERIPILGLVFSLSNRIGAAMWAVDLEKRQHYVAEVKTAAADSNVTST